MILVSETMRVTEVTRNRTGFKTDYTIKTLRISTGSYFEFKSDSPLDIDTAVRLEIKLEESP